ncbi:uncharacterized protein LOC127794644 [Diospyros lotus]|uniref:uncharacterized protein LOC127794644 n=1 Tax=Diospyros lotus TaxID=55363 RepID=UPI002252350D|nr:uncharacterized protein LOC127794644 [Diospyros lotus]
MAANSLSISLPPQFAGENYQIWSVKMAAYLKAYDLWEVVETGRDPPPLPDNPTIAQVKHHSEQVAKKFKALSCIHQAVSEIIFTRIMTCETAKEAWEKLKEEFQGTDKNRQMQLLNLRREFETLKMKDSESVKEYMNRVVKVVNQIRLLGDEFPETRIVEKVLVTLPERFESKISSLEDSKDLSKLTLSELANALQGVEQRRALRQEEASEGIQCRSCKQFGHMEKVCKNKTQQQQQQSQQAQVAESQQQQQEEQLFVACYNNKFDTNVWLVDSGCTHHMSSNSAAFKELDRSYVSSVKIGNGELVDVKGKGQ